MSLSSLPGPLEVIWRRPPLTAELARRFTSAPLPDPGGTVVDLLTTHMSVLIDDRSAPAIETAVYRAPRPDAAARADALTIRVAAQDDVCQIVYVATNAEVSAPIAIGSDSGPRLTDRYHHPDDAAARPAMAALSVAYHGTDPAVPEAVADGFRKLPPDSAAQTMNTRTTWHRWRCDASWSSS